MGAGEIVVRDNPGQDLTGLNRDPAKAQELLKDEHKGEELYASSNSVEKVQGAVDYVAEYAPHIISGLQKASVRKDLATENPDQRSAAARKLFQYQVGSDADTPAGKELSDRLADLARRDPAAASEALNAIQQLQNRLAPPGSQSFGPALEIGAVALIALAAGGVLVSTNPEYQQKVADVLASLPEAQKRNIENLTDLLGTEGFPIHKGDVGKFIFPVADQQPPATTGYGADGKVELPSHTGGDQIPQVETGNTGFPVSELPAPGNMYSDSGEKISLPESRVGHIFRDSEGHIPDTPENRELLVELANDKASVLGPDRHGTVWSAKIMPDGTQSWVQTRNGVIINGGVNAEPKPYDPERGLSSLKPRGRNDGK